MTPQSAEEVELARCAGAFVAGHQAVLDEMEHPGFVPVQLRDELRELGWLGVAEPSEGLSVTNARLLAHLIHSIARVSPALGALLLSHHFARALILEASNPPPGEPWLATAGYDGLDGCGWELTLGDDVRGTARLILGGAVAESFVLVAREADTTPVLLLLPAGESVRVLPVATLGLCGAATADLVVDWRGDWRTQEVARGSTVQRRFQAARRFVSPSRAALVAGILERSERTARSYAEVRVQGGAVILCHTAIREHLTSLARARRQADVAWQNALDSPSEVEHAWKLCRSMARRATDAGLQILGGLGYMKEAGQERWVRDARQAALLLGEPSDAESSPRIETPGQPRRSEAPDAPSAPLSSLHFPIRYRQGRAASALFAMPRGRAQSILAGSGLAPLLLTGERAVASVSWFDYPDTDIGPYRELSVSVMATPHPKPLALGLLGAWRRDPELGAWVVALPVTSELACRGGCELYGLPKTLAEIDIDWQNDRMLGQLRDGQDVIVEMTIPLRRGIPIPVRRLVLYSRLGEDLVTTTIPTRWLPRVGPGFGAELRILNPSHPLGRALSELEMDPNPLGLFFGAGLEAELPAPIRDNPSS